MASGAVACVTAGALLERATASAYAQEPPNPPHDDTELPLEPFQIMDTSTSSVLEISATVQSEYVITFCVHHTGSDWHAWPAHIKSVELTPELQQEARAIHDALNPPTIPQLNWTRPPEEL